MRNLMKFGIVLVVLAMVTGSAFAGQNDFEPGPPGCFTWFDADNWDSGYIPGRWSPNKQDARIDNFRCAVIDQVAAASGELEIRDGTLIVGVVDDPETTEIDEAVSAYYKIFKDLEMSDDSSSEVSLLDIVNGHVVVADYSGDICKKGTAVINIAEGSSLTFEKNLRVTRDSGSCTFNIAGAMACDSTNKRFEQRKGIMTVNLTGTGSLSLDGKTIRLSRDNKGLAVFNISDTAAFYHGEKIELGDDDDGADHYASLDVNISGSGLWDGSGEEISVQDEGQIIIIKVTENGSFLLDDLKGQDGAVVNLTVDGAIEGEDNGDAIVDISDDFDQGKGDIVVINGGELKVDDKMSLGDDGDATMLIADGGRVEVDRLRLGKNDDTVVVTVDGTTLYIDDDNMDDDKFIEFGDNASIDIRGDGEVVVEDADEPEDWDILIAQIAAGSIRTSEEGAVIVWDYDDSHGGKFTMQPAIPIEVDIKPGSSSNPLRVNFRGSGVITVAIVGEAGGMDVSDVDVDTVSIFGVSALRGKVGDVATTGGATLGPDGTPDMVLKFSRTDLLGALEAAYGAPLLSDLPNRAPLTLPLLGRTKNGVFISGTDDLVILNRGAIKRKK